VKQKEEIRISTFDH